VKGRAAILLSVSCLVITTLACTTKQSESKAFGAALEQTATSRAAGGENGGPVNVETAQAQATAQNATLQAVQTQANMQAAEISAATATAAAPIRAELPNYGVDPSQGNVGWIIPDLEPPLSVEGHLQYAYTNPYATITADDFVVSSDITWNTQTGVSGCGFVLRSNGNKDSLNQYLVVMTRAGQGNVIFIKQAEGQVISQDTLYANGPDPIFEWQNDMTNRLTVVGRGDTFTIYTNGTQIASVNASEYQRGLIALVALSESGRTICDFANAWFWKIDE